MNTELYVRWLRRCVQEAGYGQPERWETVLQQKVFRPTYPSDPSYGGRWEWEDVPTTEDA